MTNMPELSSRAKKALEVLSEGGQFCCRLERNNYTGREQFQYRLMKNGHVIKGVGVNVFYEIKEQFLTMAEGGTSVSTYYKLRTA